MRQSVLTLLLVFSLAFNIAFVGIWVYNRTARSGRPAGPPPGPQARGASAAERPEPPWDALKLGAEQKRSMRDSWQATGRRIQQLNAELARERDRLFDLLAAEEADEAAIAQAQKRMAELQGQVRQLAVGQMVETRTRLTPEQRRELFRRMRARGQQHGWPQRRGRPGPPPRAFGAPAPPGRQPGPERPGTPEPPRETPEGNGPEGQGL